jgi:hypothetical protein
VNSQSEGSEQRFWTRGLTALLVFAAIIGGVSFSILTMDYQADKLQIPIEKKYPYHVALTKTDVADPSRAYYLEMQMFSNTFSAQSEISIGIDINQINGTRPNSLYLLFPRANYFYEEYNVTAYNKDFHGIVIPVNPEIPYTNNTYYGNYGVGALLRYEIEGCYNIILTSDFEAVKIPNDVYDPNACSEIHIASVEVTSAAETNKANTEIAKATLKQTEIGLRITWILLLLTIYGMIFAMYETIHLRKNP